MTADGTNPPREPGAARAHDAPGTGGQGTGESRPGWHAVELEPLPRPTYWPAVMAVGIMTILWGLVTTWVASIVGAGLLAISVAGWIGDLREPPEAGGGQQP